MSFRHIFSPIQIGEVEIPNRVVRTAHGTDIGHYKVNDDLIAYHHARAKGGVGLSILETLSVHPPSSPGHLDPTDPALIPGYQRLMAAVRPHGMRVVQQIWHGGHNAHRKDGGPPWSASDRPGLWDGIPALPMTKAEITQTVTGFADAAAIVEEGGLDGVEIHGAHGYLLQQFLSPLHNHRSDEYGGSLKNRMRFMLEVSRAVRARVSRHFVVGIRLSPEAIPGGTPVEDVISVLKCLQQEQLIDYVSLSLGNYYSLHKIIGGMHEPVGYELPTSEPIGRHATVPRIVSGRFRTLEEADQVIGRGEADLVGMTRAHIADPDIVAKTRSGHEDQVRPCIGCNQGCVGGILEVGHLACTVNVAVGEERQLAEELIVPANERRRVLVVGGGPAGLEAARIAALRGHRVILAEATPDLGGNINIARKAPRRAAIGDITDWLTREVYRLGVEVRLSAYIEAEDIRELAPDAVILATGTLPREDGFQLHSPEQPVAGIDRPEVVTSQDVLRGGARAANGQAVVFDGIGHYEAVSVAEQLIDAGHTVTFVTGYRSFAPRLDFYFITEPALERMARSRRFRIMTRTKLLAVGEDQVTVAPLYAPEQTETIAAGIVAVVTAGEPNRHLREELGDDTIPVITVGDALAPRFLRLAIREGHLAARNLWA